MAEKKDYSAESLLAKEKEVELDTDNVKEETVQVPEPEKSKDETPNLNVGEVDLGYTDHPKPDDKKETEEDKTKPEIEIKEEEPKEEPKEEKKEAPQEEVSRETSEGEDIKSDLQKEKKDYQKRIDKLVYRAKEAERREAAALEFAKGLKTKFDTSDKKYHEKDDQYLKELDARVDAQREQVKVAMKSAMEAQDTTKLVEANDKLTQLAVEKEKARLELENREQLKKQAEENQQQTNVEAKSSESIEKTPRITPKAKKWAEDNAWFGTDEVMTNAAITIHNNLAREGIEVDSEEYYTEVNTRLQKYFPAALETDDKQQKEKPKPVQTVASAGRSQQGRRTVRLTKSQVAIANRLGVPLEEYARYVKEDTK
tara:strand:- start:978 stop:2087 length:1110 start_codon:yes stop_codon:yes gene_type:complete